MKLGVVGKGGVGKTTVAALLAQAYAAAGRRVLALDTDSNPNLGVSLGLTIDDAEAMPVLPRSIVVGGGGGSSAGDVVSDFGRDTPAGVKLLAAMRVGHAGEGCTCGSHAVVRSLLGEAIEETADVAIVDMEAGLEHLSRSGGTLAHADLLLVVAEPTRKSMATAVRTAALAEELGIPRTAVVGNKSRGGDDEAFFEEACRAEGLELAGVIPRDAAVEAADRAGAPATFVPGRPASDAVHRLVGFVERRAEPAAS